MLKIEIHHTMENRSSNSIVKANSSTMCDVALFTLSKRYLTVTYIVKINFDSMVFLLPDAMRG